MKENVFERVERFIDVAVKHFKSGKNAKELPAELGNVYERWEMAYRIQRKYYGRGKEYVFSVYALWIKERHNITDSRSIREDLYAAPLLFVKIEPTNREFKRMLAIERLEKSILKAEIAGKFAEQARLEAVLFKYLDPTDDPLPEAVEDETIKNFVIMPVHEPKMLGVPDLSLDEVMKFKGKMMAKHRRLLDEEDDAKYEEVKEEPLEDEYNS